MAHALHYAFCPKLNAADLKLTFELLDHDGDGQLSPTDVRKSMSMIGKRVSVEVAQEFIAEVSSGGDACKKIRSMLALLGHY